MEKYGSIKQVIDRDLIAFYDIELQLMAQEYIDTLSPAVTSMEIVQIALQMMIETVEFVKKNGKSDLTEKRTARATRLFELASRLNTLTGDNNTLQLNNKELGRQIVKLRIENIELKKQLDIQAKTYEEL